MTRWRNYLGLSALAMVAWREDGSAQGQAGVTQLVPVEARALVVQLEGRFTGGAGSIGGGVIVGVDATHLYIATAAHVVFRDSVAGAVQVRLAPPWGDSAVGVVTSPWLREIDLAVVRIARPRAASVEEVVRMLDRLGAVDELGFGTRVVPVGCPASQCWRRPATPDRIVAVDRRGILYDTQRTLAGSSGGGLFNERWEVVGLVLETEGTRGNALAMDQVLAQLKQWTVPTGLRRPRVPREGFRMVASASFFLPATGSRELRDGDRWPSGRLVLSRRSRSRIAWHASLARLAPRDVAVTAGMLGAGWPLNRGRLTITPFGEAGLANVEARFDADGFDVIGDDGVTRHAPRWQQVRNGVIGGAIGLDGSVVIARDVSVGATVGRWNVAMPAGAPELPSVFVGAGLRWNR